MNKEKRPGCNPGAPETLSAATNEGVFRDE